MKKNFLLKLSVTALSLLAFIGLAAPQAKAQIGSTLYTFGSAAGDGYTSYGGLIQDASGNLFGTTYQGGANNEGTVFELVKSGSTYTEKVLYSFSNGPYDGAYPYAGLVMDGSGNLYGTTAGGGPSYSGTVFELAYSSGAYTEKVLYSFSGYGPSTDGGFPYGNLLLDASGNLFGTTNLGGTAGLGTIFELRNSSSGYTEKVLYNFAGGSDGAHPVSGLISDASGNLYGTTSGGGGGNSGTVFELAYSSGAYSEAVLYAFTGSAGDGAGPVAGLLRDASGNLYGTTSGGGTGNSGTVFELLNASGAYSEKVLYAFGAFPDGSTPYQGLIMDPSGNLYGTTLSGGAVSEGTVFELINASGVWSESQLLSLGVSCNGQGVGAANPYWGNLVMDASGVLYGTAQSAVFAVTPSTAVTQTTMGLASSANPVEAGLPVTITATATSSSGYPAGNIVFSNASGAIGSAPLVCGAATVGIPDALILGIGTNPITAAYTPVSAGYSPSAATFSQTVTEPGVVLENGGNTLNGNQTVNGSLAATSFSGNGSGLLNLNPANLGPGTANISITGQAGSALIAASLSGNILESQVTGLATDMAGKVPLSAIGTANGVAALDAAGRVPAAQLPAATAGGSPAILVATCTGAASSAKGSTFAFEGLGAIGNETCGNAVSASTAVGIPMAAAGTLSGLNVYPGAAGNSGTAITFTVYKAAAPGWTVSSGANQTTISAVSFNRGSRRVTLTVGSGTNFAVGNTITVSGITGTYNAGTNCTALTGASFDGTFTVAANSATTVAFTDSALPSNCGSNINSAPATGTVADSTNPTYSTATRTVPLATALTCTIGALTTSASAVCSDTTDTIAVNPGDLISIIATSSRASGTETIGEIRITLQKQ